MIEPMSNTEAHNAKRVDYVKSLQRIRKGFWPSDVCHCDYDDPPDCDCHWCNVVLASRNRELAKRRAGTPIQNIRTADGSRVIRHFHRRRP